MCFRQFFKSVNNLPENVCTPMTRPFEKEEIRNAISKLKNNKSPGIDGMGAELLKYGPSILYDEIALIFNNMGQIRRLPT